MEYLRICYLLLIMLSFNFMIYINVFNLHVVCFCKLQVLFILCDFDLKSNLGKLQDTPSFQLIWCLQKFRVACELQLCVLDLIVHWSVTARISSSLAWTLVICSVRVPIPSSAHLKITTDNHVSWQNGIIILH